MDGLPDLCETVSGKVNRLAENYRKLQEYVHKPGYVNCEPKQISHLRTKTRTAATKGEGLKKAIDRLHERVTSLQEDVESLGINNPQCKALLRKLPGVATKVVQRAERLQDQSGQMSALWNKQPAIAPSGISATQTKPQVDFFVTGLALFAVVMFLAKKFLRRQCHFCEEETLIWSFDNSWTCPECEGYNGFSRDGGYDNGAPTMDAAEPPVPYPSVSISSFSVRTGGVEHLDAPPNLCRTCRRRRANYVAELRKFEPTDEDDPDQEQQELTEYKANLEQKYALCGGCEARIKRHLAAQQRWLHKQPSSNDIGRRLAAQDYPKPPSTAWSNNHMFWLFAAIFAWYLYNNHKNTKDSSTPSSVLTLPLKACASEAHTLFLTTSRQLKELIPMLHQLEEELKKTT